MNKTEVNYAVPPCVSRVGSRGLAVRLQALENAARRFNKLSMNCSRRCIYLHGTPDSEICLCAAKSPKHAVTVPANRVTLGAAKGLGQGRAAPQMFRRCGWLNMTNCGG